MEMAVQCPNNECGPQAYYDGSHHILSSPFKAYADGTSSYWVDENDPNHVKSKDPDVIDVGGTRTRFVQTSEMFPIYGDKPWYAVGFDDNQKQTIEIVVKSMATNEACSKAFKNAGLTSVAEMKKNGFLIFVNSKQLTDSANNNNWMGNEELRKGMMKTYDKSSTINGVTQNDSYKGNYYVSLRDRAFTDQDDTPYNIIIHELIHAGGKPGNSEDIPLEDKVFFNPKTGYEITSARRL